MSIKQIRDPLYQLSCDLCDENAHEGAYVPSDWMRVTITFGASGGLMLHCCPPCAKRGAVLPRFADLPHVHLLTLRANATVE